MVQTCLTLSYDLPSGDNFLNEGATLPTQVAQGRFPAYYYWLDSGG